MQQNVGKKFEEHFLEDWRRSLPNSFIFRLHDQVSGYKTVSKNPCDFIGFCSGKLFLIETKSINGNTFPIANLTQYSLLYSYSGIEGVFPIVIIWFKDHDKIICVKVEEFKKLKDNNKKSLNIKHIQEYQCIEVPSKKLIKFLQSDYSCLLNL